MHACRIVCGYNSGVRLNRRIEGAKQHRMRRVAQVYFLCVCAAVSHIIPAYEKQFFFGQMLTHMFGIIERSNGGSGFVCCGHRSLHSIYGRTCCAPMGAPMLGNSSVMRV